MPPCGLSPNERSNGLSLRESPWDPALRDCEKFDPVGREWVAEVFLATGSAKGAVRETVVKLNGGDGCR